LRKLFSQRLISRIDINTRARLCVSVQKTNSPVATCSWSTIEKTLEKNGSRLGLMIINLVHLRDR
jgi:hypothetical protein